MDDIVNQAKTYMGDLPIKYQRELHDIVSKTYTDYQAFKQATDDFLDRIENTPTVTMGEEISKNIDRTTASTVIDMYAYYYFNVQSPSLQIVRSVSVDSDGSFYVPSREGYVPPAKENR